MPARNNVSTPIADLLDILPDAVLMVDGQGFIVYANPATRGLLGYPPQELVGQPLAVLIPQAMRERHAAMVQSFICEGAPTSMGARPVLHAVHRGGVQVPVSISLCNWTLDGGERVSVAVIRDMAELNTHLDRVTLLAETDPVSGLGNRLKLSRHMKALLTDEQPFAILYIDLQRFKQLNDTHGHAAGDRALAIVAHRLQSHVRDGDLVSRLGGDEFVVLLRGIGDRSQLERRALAIAATVAEPVRLDDGAFTLRANIGGALSPHDGPTEAALLAAADSAMYAAKQAGEPYRPAAA